MTKVALVPYPNLGQNRLFSPEAGRDNCLERYVLLQEALRSQGMACDTVDVMPPAEVDVLIFHDLHRELDSVLRVVKANPSVRLIYIAIEPSFIAPLHEEGAVPHLPVDRVLTWNDRVAGKHPRVVKCNIGEPVIDPAKIPAVPFAHKRLICCVYSNKSSSAPDALYAERLRAIEFFHRLPGGIHLYGMGWESSKNPFVWASFRGSCQEKREVLQRYRFCLAYENMKDVPGLITEKIFDCFAAGTVPVYHGAPNIREYIPRSCYIDFRDFADYQQLYEFLSYMSQSQYEAYLSAAREFIKGNGFYQFCSRRYVEIVVEQIKAVMSQPAMSNTPGKMKLRLLKLLARNPRLVANWRPTGHLLARLVKVW